MKKLLLFVVIILTKLTHAQCTFGNYPPLSSTSSNFSGGKWIACSYTLPTTATLTALGANGATPPWNSVFKMAIFTDVSNAPGAFITETTIGPLQSGYNIMNVVTPTVLPAGVYWIACGFQASGQLFTYTTSSTPLYYFYTGGGGIVPSPSSPTWSVGTNLSLDMWAIINSPNISITGAGTVCAGSNLTLTANGATNYTWSTGSNATTISVSPTVMTTYTLSSLGSNGCTGINTKQITIYSSPTISVLNSTLCSGQTLTVTASGVNTINITASGNGATSFSTSVLTTTLHLIPPASDNYTFSATSNYAGCSSTVIQSITVLPLPQLTCSGNNTVCSFSTLTLTASGASTYSWSTGSTSPSMTAAPFANTSYGLSGTDTYGCSSYTIISVSVAISSLAITGPSIVCENTPVVLTATGAISYTWNSGSGITTPTIGFYVPANMVIGVNAIEANGCARYTNFAITAMASPTLNTVLSNNTLCVGETGSISVSGANTYTWNTSSTNSLIVVSPSLTTTYTVNGEGTNGCVTTASITQVVDACAGIRKNSSEVRLLSVYPNPGAGVFTIKTTNNNELATLKIYDTSGKIILEIKKVKADQELDLKDHPAGLYFLIYRDENESEMIRLIKE